MPPPHEGRLRYFLYGCAEFSWAKEIELAGGKQQKRQLGEFAQ
jgi:hypothetical protein